MSVTFLLFHSIFLDLVMARVLQLHCLHGQSPFGNVDLFISTYLKV